VKGFSQKISPAWVLRITLGAMYLYSGSDLLRHPAGWQWAIPYWLRTVISSAVDINRYIQFQGILEILVALIFLAPFASRRIVSYAAMISALEFAAILLLALIPFSESNFLITFRDIGLLGASFALFLVAARNGESPIKL
jgi:hypothetical protein